MAGEGPPSTTISKSVGHAEFVLNTSTGTITARNVVIATGPYQQPVIPDAAEGLGEIVQLSASGYRSPAQLPPGGVLVVGAGASGCQIAEELLRSCPGSATMPPLSPNTLTPTGRVVHPLKPSTSEANMTDTGLSPQESHDLRRVAGLMVPASTEYKVPGADDPKIFADIETSIGRDLADVCKAMAAVAGIAEMDDANAMAVAETFRSKGGAQVAAVERCVLQCYYRDDRVVISLGLEARPPFPLGHTLEQGDWSLLDPVRARPKMWRDA
jgi:hypothetical protein